MKISSKAEVVINLGDYQHLKLEVCVEDKRQRDESNEAACARMNYLARRTLLQQMDVLLSAQPQWKQDEAYALVGIKASVPVPEPPSYVMNYYHFQSQIDDDEAIRRANAANPPQHPGVEIVDAEDEADDETGEFVGVVRRIGHDMSFIDLPTSAPGDDLIGSQDFSPPTNPDDLPV